MSADLSDVLGRAAGGPEGRPDLGVVWSAGRRRRRRTRAVRAAALVAVVALAGGAVALATAGDGSGEDLVAGPGDGVVEAPPPEPPVDVVVLEVQAGPEVDGLPTAVEGEALRVTYVGATEGFARGRLAAWEVWDGEAWSEQWALVAADTDGGAHPGEVAPPDPPPTVPEDRRSGAGPDVFPTPDDLEPGWYRVCVPMTATASGGLGGTIPAGAGPGVTAPPMTTFDAADEIRPCGQLRVPEPGDASPAAVAPPPEPEGEITLFTPTPEIHPAEDVTVWLSGDLAGWAVGFGATWEAWSFEGWQVTHVLQSRVDDAPDAMSAPRPAATRPPLAVDAPASRATQVLVTPVVEPGWYRVCKALGFQEVPSTPPTRERVACAQVQVTEGPEGSLPPERPEPGAAATWVVDPADPPAADDTTVSVLVTPLGCAGGEPGTVLRPGVEEVGGDVVVIFTVEPRDPPGCAGGAPIPATLDLGEPLGDRGLADGACMAGERRASPGCEGLGRRWPQP